MTAWDWISNALLSMIPPVAVGLVFWVIMRSILKADATERKVYAEIEAEERAKQAAAGTKKPAKSGSAKSEQPRKGK